MKRFSLFASVILLVCAYACQLETEIQLENSGFKTVTINAGDAGTRTAVLVDGSNYSVTWKAGDQISVAEVIQANYGIDKGPDPVQIVTSNPLAADAAKASFTVTLADRTSNEANPTHGDFTYIGVYPASSLYDVRWTGNERAAWEEHWGNTTTPDHPVLLVELPTYQHPTADSFDPAADVMVSRAVTSATQPGSLSMSFARVGTIAKITFTGLPSGKTITSGQLTFSPEDWPGAYIVEYDPVLGGTGIFNKTGGLISFGGDEVTIDADGKAVIWLRTLSGTLNEWVRFDLWLPDTEGEIRYEKYVDLSALGRSITFPESGVTAFSVAMERHYDLVMTMESHEATETSLTLNMVYGLGGKPHTSVTYGLIRFDPSTSDPMHTVSRASAAPEDIIILVPDGAGRVSHTDTGLTPDTDYCYMPFIDVDGTEYHPEYSPLTLHTLVHYDYPEPSLVDLGLPSGTKWASFNLGSDAPLTAGFYFKWGEVRPTVSFTNSYSSKYWSQASWSSPGRAKKYSTCAADGYDGLVDLLTVLEPEDDAATVNLGGDWRTPTTADYKELFENCNVSEVAGGFVFTSRINGASVTFPDCGYYQGSSKQSRSYMMTATLCVDGATSRNNCYYSEVASSPTTQYASFTGATRGYWKSNIRPVSGGVRAGFDWSVHCDVSGIASGQATIIANYLEAEDSGCTYTYNAYLCTDITGEKTIKSMTRSGSTGSVTYTGLTPGTTYYYYVYWRSEKGGVYQGSGESEVRSFVAE